MLTNKLTGAGAADKTYIEDVFSTYLYTGNSSTQTINNGIDLAGKGGMVWIKERSANTFEHQLFDTARGINLALRSNSTVSQTDYTSVGGGVNAFNNNGFSLGSYSRVNYSTATYASWTFRKAPKFFDVVTWTGTGSSVVVNHSLGVVPGMIVMKQTNSGGSWDAWHRSLSSPYTGLIFNDTSAASSGGMFGGGYSGATANNITIPYSTNGETYVAYLFAHDTTTDGLIQCGSFASATTVTLGWEPQYVLFKSVNASEWFIHDSMRGMPVSGNQAELFANQNWEEGSSIRLISPTPTGFKTDNVGGSSYIYMAIRRGPMRTPTDGTKVFSPVVGTTRPATITTNIVTDMQMTLERDGSYRPLASRLTGNDYLLTNQTVSIQTGNPKIFNFALQNQIYQNAATSTINYAFRRAPGFFDVVCYTGTGVARTVNHNLGVAPELMIVKNRDSDDDWIVYSSTLGNTKAMFLDMNISPSTSSTFWNNTSSTASVFTCGTANSVNVSAGTFVAYLFASCPGVSKVGSYTGNGSTQTINCGFTNGARFVLIKRTNSTGDWYVWDTARGIVAATDPHLSLNSQAAEVTTDDTIDPTSTGFIVNQVTATNVNVSSATYIYLAIA